MQSEQEKVEMAPSFRELWDVVSQGQIKTAELRGMVTMHLQDTVHHSTPCPSVESLQNVLRTMLGAALVSMASAIGCLFMELIRFFHG